MRAILIVPENERAGLTGSPLVSNSGMVSAINGSFQAGKKADLHNMKNITAKLQEAQKAITQASTSLDKTDVMLETINNQTTQVNKEMNFRQLVASKYWQRWDSNPLTNRDEQIRFWATAIANDTIRDALLGETIDGYTLTNADGRVNGTQLIPRGSRALTNTTYAPSYPNMFFQGALLTANGTNLYLHENGYVANTASTFGGRPQYGTIYSMPDPTFSGPNIIPSFSITGKYYAERISGFGVNTNQTFYQDIVTAAVNSRNTVITAAFRLAKLSGVTYEYRLTNDGTIEVFMDGNNNIATDLTYDGSTGIWGYHGHYYYSQYEMTSANGLTKKTLNVSSLSDWFEETGYANMRPVNLYGFAINTSQVILSYPTPNESITVSYATYPGNLLNIKPQLIGGRQVNTTYVVKTRVTMPNGLYLSNIIEADCSDGKRYMLMERNYVSYNSGSGAHVKDIEQIVFNFNPKATTGDLFTRNNFTLSMLDYMNFQGYIHEVFYNTWDGHTVSLRPQLVATPNFIGSDLINFTVTYNDFVSY